MFNYIIYHVSTIDEINECAYSLLKYLDVYNLKPPADHRVIIYTDQPALLESYGPFLNGFELREIVTTEKDTNGLLVMIKKFCKEQTGNILYLGTATYPVKDLSMLFSNMERGTVYGSHYPTPKLNKAIHGVIKKDVITVLGFSSATRSSIDDLRLSEDLKSVKGTIEEYADLSEFRILLKEFFTRNQEESIPNLVKLIHHINARQIQEQKQQYQQLPVHVRFLRKILGRGWHISQYAGKN